MSADLECPYCGADNDVCHDDGQGYEEGVAHEMDCCECGKNFVFYTAISYDYSPQKADCLNGSPHNFGEWCKLWECDDGGELQYRECKDCEHREERVVKEEAKP